MSKIPDTFKLTIYDETGMLFSDMVQSIEAVNETGPFSVLSGHTNFISVITGSLNENKLVVHLADNSTQEFILQKGVFKMFENEAEVYIVFDLNVTL